MKKILPVFIFIIFIFKQSATVAQAINTQDSLALVDLYDSTDGPHWKNSPHWLTSDPVSSWYGVTVVGDRVTRISLSGNNLTGKIPQSIGNLTAMQKLDFFTNNLTGVIPATIVNLTALTGLRLSTNQLSGAIPASLSNLVNLKVLMLDNNLLSDTIPASLGNLANLTYIDLSYNQLTGQIPVSVGNLKLMTQFFLDHNKLTGSIPASLGNIAGLTNIALSVNQLSGPIPEELGNLKQLQYLQIEQNKLSGSIPASLGNFSNLIYFFVSDNELTGEIPASLGNLTSVSGLDLSNNHLTGSIPESLGNLPIVDWIALYHNELTGQIPASLGNLKTITSLYLHYNKLSGAIPASLGSMPLTTDLLLDHNELTGIIPPELGNLTNLQHFTLNHNALSGTVPAAIGSLTNLQDVELDSNKLSGTLKPFSHYTTLNTFTVQSNNFTFNGMEDVASAYAFAKYTPQAHIPFDRNGDKITVDAGGTLANDTFRLYKNGTLYKTQTGDSVFSITQPGKYNITVTNSVAKKLTLYSDTANIQTLAEGLIGLTGAAYENTIKLQWQVAKEVNAQKFIVQRGATAADLETVGTVNATGASDYNFIDTKPLSGNNFYRLKMADANGLYTYSSTIVVKSIKSAVFNVYPNPVINNITVSFTAANVSKYTIVVTDINGRIVKNIAGTAVAGANTANISMQNLAEGSYLLTVNYDADNKSSVHIIKE